MKIIRDVLLSVLYITTVTLGFYINAWCGIGVLLLCAAISLLTDRRGA